MSKKIKQSTLILVTITIWILKYFLWNIKVWNRLRYGNYPKYHAPSHYNAFGAVLESRIEPKNNFIYPSNTFWKIGRTIPNPPYETQNHHQIQWENKIVRLILSFLEACLTK